MKRSFIISIVVFGSFLSGTALVEADEVAPVPLARMVDLFASADRVLVY